MIHKTAIVEQGAEIGENCSIGAYSVIGPKVKISKNNIIGPHVIIEGDTEIGENNHFFQFSSVGAPPQDLKYEGEGSKLIIGSSNIIREYVTLQPGSKKGSVTVVGDKNLFMASSHVAHDCIIGNNCWFANCATLAGYVTIGNGVVFGGLSGVHQFCKVGDVAFIGAGSIVTQDVPPYCVVQGDRANIICVNKAGLIRNKFSKENIDLIDDIFRIIFFNANTKEEKIKLISYNYPDSDLALKFVNFLVHSKRGIPPLRIANVSV